MVRLISITLFRKKPKIMDGMLKFEEPTIDCRLADLNALLEDGYQPILKFPIPDPINLNVIAVFILYKPDHAP